MRTFLATAENNSGIAQVGNIFLIKAKSKKCAVEILHSKTNYHKEINYDIVDIGKELENKNYWSLYY